MNKQKGFSTLLGLLLVLAVAGGGAYWYKSSNKLKTGVTVEENSDGAQNSEKIADVPSKKPDTTVAVKNKIQVVSPNAGEKLYYPDISMAGELYATWKASSDTSSYIPSSNLKVYILNSVGQIMREDAKIEARSLISLGNATYKTYFTGAQNLSIDTNYRIKVCDDVDGKQYCDESDGYFSLTNSQQQAGIVPVSAPIKEVCSNGATNYPRCNSDLPMR